MNLSGLGIELTISNVAALYFIDYFGLGLAKAGLVAVLFGLMDIFARTKGGIIGVDLGRNGGLKGRVRWLFIASFIGGMAPMLFSRMTDLPVAIGTMVVFSMFTKMSEGAAYFVVPFINKKALGSVAGIAESSGDFEHRHGRSGHQLPVRGPDTSHAPGLRPANCR